ncbi:hypothetical protein MDOR_18550 [Mycolicibacterium doricum]|jgi:hypothetical protein|uniref:Uncharacterized protein n=1 Tax=Mycolicibacterium doricum TaxID=126673 RepID=A0A7I7VQX8_9MYCO|nr:hypothetical protein MDOR_18550 [Mycolicibacterium doricum]
MTPREVMSAPLRVKTVVVGPAARNMDLKPSHLNSVAHWAPVGGTPSVASIGSGTAGGLAAVAIGAYVSWLHQALSG